MAGIIAEREREKAGKSRELKEMREMVRRSALANTAHLAHPGGQHSTMTFPENPMAHGFPLPALAVPRQTMA
jgi:hypothetical protein